MGWNDPDVYYNPEEFGLTIVANIEWENEAYQFNQTVVWVDENGQLYIASDSGCSCPSPFEYITSLEGLEKVSKFEAAEKLKDYAEEQKPDGEDSLYGRTQGNYERVMGEVVDAIVKIMKVAA